MARKLKDLPTPKTPKHCDDYIEDAEAPEVLRKFLAWARSPAHGLTQPEPYPKLFADYKGQRVRVTMASRLGDVGLSTNFKADTGWWARCHIEELSNFSDTE